MQIFVSGTWKREKAGPYADQAALLGGAIAAAGFDLACGPGTGIARHVIDGFRGTPGHGTVRYYLPSAEAMALAGETVEPGADVVEQTELDYPMRNVLQVKRSDGLFVLTGGDGTLEEILPAVIDYRIPVAALAGAGTAVAALEALIEIFPAWRSLVRIESEIQPLIDDFFGRVRSGGQPSAHHPGG